MASRMSMSLRRQILIDAARAVCLREGVGAATTRAIAAEAQMPLASVHYAFRSREELIEEVVNDLISDLSPERFEREVPATTPQELLTHVLEQLCDEIITRPEESLLRLELANYSLRYRTGPCRQHLALLNALAHVLASVEASGHRWEVPVDQVAWQVSAFNDAVSQSYPITRDAEAVRRLARLTASAIATQASRVRLGQETG